MRALFPFLPFCVPFFVNNNVQKKNFDESSKGGVSQLSAFSALQKCINGDKWHKMYDPPPPQKNHEVITGMRMMFCHTVDFPVFGVY